MIELAAPNGCAPNGCAPNGTAPNDSARHGATRTGSLLARVILPRAGDPLDVRALYLDEDEGNRKRAAADSRTQLRLPAQSEISFASYFNAFPASYWRRWSVLENVELRLAVDAECRIDIYRSKADGTQIHVRGQVLGEGARSGSGVQQGRFVLDLRPFETAAGTGST